MEDGHGIVLQAVRSESHVKNGLMRGKQRYLCKACGLNFTDTPVPGKPLAMRATAVLLYVSGLSMNRTGKLLGVSICDHQAGSSSSPRSTPRNPRRKAGRW